MRLQPFVRVFCAITAMVFASNARAQSVSSRGISGIISPLRGGENVRLLQHETRVTLPSRRVQSHSVLVNGGAATTVTIALPETGELGESGLFPRAGFLRDLQITVDGKRANLRRDVPKDGLLDENNYEFEYSIW